MSTPLNATARPLLLLRRHDNLYEAVHYYPLSRLLALFLLNLGVYKQADAPDLVLSVKPKAKNY